MEAESNRASGRAVALGGLFALLLLSALFNLSCHQAGPARRREAMRSAPWLALRTDDPARVSLLVFGDWGQNTRAEREVADGIRAYGGKYDAGLLLGDNFYMSLTGVDDPRWRTLFEDLYEPRSLRFFAALGNHDYSTPAGPRRLPWQKSALPRQTNKDVELEYARLHPNGRWNLPAPWYRIDLPPDDPLVTVLVLDSNHQQKDMSAADWEQQGQWLRAQLEELRPTDGSKSGRRWVICCAHHPIYTNGAGHSDDERLKREWRPLFETHRVDFYLAGHNHCMEHVRVPGSAVSYVVSGGGGARLYGERRRHRGWFARRHGFTHLILTEDAAEARFLDKTGRLLYSFTRAPAGPERIKVEAATRPETAPATTIPADADAAGEGPEESDPTEVEPAGTQPTVVD